MIKHWTVSVGVGFLCFGLAVLSVLGEEQRPKEPKESRPDPFEQPVVSPEGVKVALELRTAELVIKEGQKIVWSLELVNLGKKEVTLVQPGDGSDCAWRTPLIQWRINGQGPRGEVGRCGNINSLRPNEVFTLKPGQRVKLNEWVRQPALIGTGKFQVSFRYVNLPSLTWGGLPLGKHDEATMAQVRHSTPLDVKSNVVEINVVK